MKLTFHGAAETTTGSQHLLEVNGRRILLDCGLYQGHREDAYTRNKHFPFSPAELDAVILSHAHIDHSGNLPNLTRNGYRGNIYCTPATRDLCQIMLADSANIQISDVEYVNRKRRRDGLPEFSPLYSPEDAERCLRQFVSFTYHRPMPVVDGVTVTFLDAGHILGAAQVVLDIEERTTGRKKRLLFSGDIGRGKNDLLRDPENATDVDFVIMESTYGGREHEIAAGTRKHFAAILRHALANRGKVLIPAFAVERTQQVLYVLNELLEAGDIAPVPVYVDSPLAVSATEIFQLHPECFNETVYRFLFEKRNPFGFEGLTLIRSADDSRALNGRDGPFIIIAASGMCEAGRILHHLKNNLQDARTTVLFVGYCAQNTLGWKLRNGHTEVSVLGERRRVHARIEAIDSLSGHADHSELLEWFAAMTGPKQRVWLVHGEVERSTALQSSLSSAWPGHSFEVARLGQTVEF